jgi:hypothetical protein
MELRKKSKVAHEIVWRSGYVASPFLTLAVEGGEWAT